MEDKEEEEKDITILFLDQRISRIKWLKKSLLPTKRVRLYTHLLTLPLPLKTTSPSSSSENDDAIKKNRHSTVW